MSGPNGHVPVGTGGQLPIGMQPYYQPAQTTVVVVNPRPGVPARQLPNNVRSVVETRTRYHGGRPVVADTARYQADRDVRQVPGTNAAVQTFRNTHK